MRIIDGIFKKHIIRFNKNIKIRPTTDFAKEGLFNIIKNYYVFEKINVLDLFSGSGNISYEFSSRGALSVISVDKNRKCINFIKNKNKIMNMNIKAIKSDVLKYIKSTTTKFDIIFADPPYIFKDIYLIHNTIFDQKILINNGLLIIEHSKTIDFSSHKKYKETRTYGKVNFSFFVNNKK